MINVSDIVFTRCKDVLESEYEGVFVSSSKTISPTELPACSIVQIGAPAIGSSFNNKQHACISTIEIQTYSLKAREAKEMIATVADKMNDMVYAMIYGPEQIEDQNNLTRYVARFRRTIGAGDSL